MREESPLLLPPAEESPEADTEPAAPEPEPAEPAPAPDSEPAFVCECNDWMRSACNSEPFYKEDKGKWYCVLHYPGKEKAADFDLAFRKKLEAKDFNFYGVWFPEAVNFNKFEFSGTADFYSATFSAGAYFTSATFSAEANFGSATFSGTANFYSATFSAGAYFRFATFSGTANFYSATFSARANFTSATFSAGAYFTSATFSAEANFGSATFKDQVSFSGIQNFGNQSALDLQFARIEEPERLSFHTVRLRPHWFVNVEPRKFVFIDVSWNWGAISIKGEIRRLDIKYISSPHRLLEIACHQLAENAEANNRYEEASRFRYWAMDLARRDKWKGWTFWETDWLHIFYWAVSGYGERILRAFGWLLGVLIIFALLYTQVGFTQPANANAASTTSEDNTGRPLALPRAITYSLGVMSLQRPEPRPVTNWAHALVTLEMILGPVQAALLVLAIRRKFMR
jgi:hypothetical protein